jgi:hypothetical protein
MIKQLIQQMNSKRKELLNLEIQYEQEINKEKKEILKSKNKNMDKSLYLLSFDFESSSIRTSQYLEFHKIFKKEFKELLNSYCKKIEISKPNHFDLTGFFELNNGKIYYISIGDLRSDKDDMMIREAKNFRDYTGGSNNHINLDKNFAENLKKFLELK